MANIKNRFFCSGSADKTIRIWNTNDNYNCVKILKGHTEVYIH